MDMKACHDELEQVALEGFKKINSTRTVENKRWEVPVGSWDVSVVRGKVLEKATTSRIRLKTKNPTTGEETQFDVFQVKVYPASPKIPIMLFNLENRAAKEDIFAGFLDVAPVATSRRDLNFLQAEIKKITEKYGVDYEALRRKLENIYKMDHWDKALNAGIGIRLELSKEQFDLVKEAARIWVESYFKIVEKRVREPFSKKQEDLMYSVRARIMEFYMLKDLSFRVSQKLGVPLEALTLGLFAPTVKY
ncbi:MAG: coproporphyrinogen III oxidase [Proteobacteria bacterium]|nr:coproporphyrinogen III oxidase [Pseudomonadota bacterium]